MNTGQSRGTLWRLVRGGGSSAAPPLTPPSATRSALLATLILGFLALLGRLEAGTSPPYPLAAVITGILAFAVLCVTQLEVAFLLILAVAPFSVESVVPGTGSALQVPTEPMLMVALAVWTARSLVRRPRRLAQPALMAALFLTLGAIGVSIAVSAFRFAALKATAVALWYGLYGVFVLNNFADRGRLKLLPWALLLPGVVISLYSIVNVLIGHYEPLLGLWWGPPFFTEHGTFSAYLSFACALAVGLALEMTGGLKLILGLIALVTGAEVVLSMTRGAWLGLVGLAVFLLVVSWKRVARIGNMGFLMIGLVGLIASLMAGGALHALQDRSHTITDPTNVATLERVNRWAAGYGMFRAAPLTGVGFGAYPDAYLNYRRFTLGTDQSLTHMGVHSEYLKILAETGLLGAVTSALVCVFVVLIAIRAIRGARDPYVRGLAVGLAGGLVTYALHATVNNYMGYDKLAVPIWIAVGALGAIDTLNRE